MRGKGLKGFEHELLKLSLTALTQLTMMELHQPLNYNRSVIH